MGVEELCVEIIGWSAAFVVVRLIFRHRSHDFCNRCVSMLHVFVAVYLCMVSVSDWSRPLEGVGAPSSALQIRAMTVSLAYFIYDFFCCLWDVPIGVSNCVHHLITIMGLAFGFAYGSCGTELVACLWLMELSNPFMHFRVLMKELGIHDTPLNLINDLSFVIVFTIARLIIGPFVVYKTLEAESPIAVKIGGVGIQIVSIFWFNKIARMAWHKLVVQKRKPA